MAASAANSRPVLPAAVTRPAPFFEAGVFDEAVGFKPLVLTGVDCVTCTVVPAAVL